MFRGAPLGPSSSQAPVRATKMCDLRATVVALGFSVFAFSAAAAHAETGLDWLPADDAEAAVPCAACRFPCAKGTVNCWACGAHVPGAKTAKDLAPVKIIITSFKKGGEAKAADVAAVSPDIEYEEIESWIAENPDGFDEAISRLSELLKTVRGTALEGTVTTRLEQLRQAKTEASKPKTRKELEAEAATAVIKVMGQVRASKNVEKNIERLGKLLKTVEGTSYEQYVQTQLEREMEKKR